jgi:hypothetical protein
MLGNLLFFINNLFTKEDDYDTICFLRKLISFLGDNFLLCREYFAFTIEASKVLPRSRRL